MEVRVRAMLTFCSNCTVSDPDAVQSTISTVVKDFGKIDVFVANAGTLPGLSIKLPFLSFPFRTIDAVNKCKGMAISKPILSQTLSEYKAQLSVNVDGIVYCAKFAGEVFARQRTGNLIITSSMSAHIVNVPTDQPIYNATKAFVTHFGKSLAREWREFARVNIVSPGFFDTKMGASPETVNEAYRMAVLGRQGSTKEIKGIYLYLASDASSYMTGSDVLIDGGYVLP